MSLRPKYQSQSKRESEAFSAESVYTGWNLKLERIKDLLSSGL
jgi:hypothetical protein